MACPVSTEVFDVVGNAHVGAGGVHGASKSVVCKVRLHADGLENDLISVFARSRE